MFNEDFFKKLNKINMYINFKLTGGTQGGRKSKAKGVSVEFSDYREYAPGDDFRRIDWNAYGRFDKFFIKVFMEEREGVFNFFIDKSKSMDYGKDNKKDTALKIVAALSYIALNNSGLESLEAGLKYLAYKKQEIILVQVLCEEEINPEFNNEITLIDSETGENIKLSVTPSLIKDYKETLKKYNDSIEALARKYGGKLITVNSSMNIEEIILNEFSKRKVLY